MDSKSHETTEYGGFLLMMDTVPEKSEYDYGMNYCRIVSTYIPRIVWPTKPLFGRSQWVSAWIAGSELERDEEFTGPAIGILERLNLMEESSARFCRSATPVASPPLPGGRAHHTWKSRARPPASGGTLGAAMSPPCVLARLGFRARGTGLDHRKLIALRSVTFITTGISLPRSALTGSNPVSLLKEIEECLI